MTPPRTQYPAVQGASGGSRGTVPKLGKQDEDRQNGPDTERTGVGRRPRPPGRDGARRRATRGAGRRPCRSSPGRGAGRGMISTHAAVPWGLGPCALTETRSPAARPSPAHHPRLRARFRGLCHQEAPQEDGQEEAPQASEEDAGAAPQARQVSSSRRVGVRRGVLWGCCLAGGLSWHR